MKRRMLALLLCIALLLPFAAMADGYTMAGCESTDYHDWSTNEALHHIEQTTGITVTYKQYTSAGEWTTVKAAMTADSAELPDALFKASLTRDEMETLYANGVLIDLRPMLEEYAPNLWKLLQEHPDWVEAISLRDGAIVALPNINMLQNNNAIWINTKWLKKVGMEMPATAEELTEVLRAFKTQDPNGNYKSDEIPLTYTGMWDLHWLAHAYGIVANDYHITVKDGKAVSTLTSDENRAFLTWVHELYAENLIDHTGLTSPDSSRQITDSDATITYGVVMGPSILYMLPTNQMENYDVLIPLQYNGTQIYRKLMYEVTGGTFAITSKCANPTELLSWADRFYTEEFTFLTQAGEQGKEYELYSDGKWKWIASNTTVAETVMPNFTIANGTIMHGITSKEFQLNYDDASTSRAVKQLAELDQYTVYPFPAVAMSAADTDRINEIWSELGPYCEQTMARFISGDYELNDKTWAEYCTHCEELGLSEMVSLWQKALD